MANQSTAVTTSDRIRHAVQTLGTAKTAALLGMDRETTLAIAAGARVREGSLLLADLRVDALPNL